MHIKRHHPNRKKMTVGRGGKRGKTSGRGTKGQKSRAGHKIRPAMRDTIKKLPRLRGVTIHKRGAQFTSVGLAPVTVTLAALASLAGGEIVTPALLLERGIVARVGGRVPKVKVLGEGDLEGKLVLKGITASASAKKKIEAAGGSIAL
ncbi:uL15 family ribosomal protein [Candidatus Parcubacteria bacterium]|nr:uL15 family ribosomal protein [Candidatus Parcubacteria bacterium]